MIPLAPPPHLLVNVDEITAMGREHPGVGAVLDALGRLAAAMPPPRLAALPDPCRSAPATPTPLDETGRDTDHVSD
jgi:hypothetical protein